MGFGLRNLKIVKNMLDNIQKRQTNSLFYFGAFLFNGHELSGQLINQFTVAGVTGDINILFPVGLMVIKHVADHGVHGPVQEFGKGIAAGKYRFPSYVPAEGPVLHTDARV
jgi:hypothetical protein